MTRSWASGSSRRRSRPLAGRSSAPAAHRWRHPGAERLHQRRRQRHHPGVPVERPGGDIAGSGAINGTLDLIDRHDLTQTADCVGPPRSRPTIRSAPPSTPSSSYSPWPFQAKAPGSTGNKFPIGPLLRGRHRPHSFLGPRGGVLRELPRRDPLLDPPLDAVPQGLRRRQASRPASPRSSPPRPDSSGVALTSIVLGVEHLRLEQLITGTGSSSPLRPAR